MEPMRDGHSEHQSGAGHSMGASLRRGLASWGCVSGWKKEGEEAFPRQQGSCQKESRSPRPSVYCSLSQCIFCYIMHQADP